MKNNRSIKNIASTALSAVCVLALIVLCVAFGGGALTREQLSTLRILLIVCGASILYCFAVGEASKNYSQMDKLWSLLPIAYTWIVAARGGMKTRLVVFALIVTAWGIRLTVNFARKGAYSLKFWTGTEDYRWAIVRGTRFFKSKPAWTCFNLFFISIYQNLLVLSICLPALACMGSSAPFGVWDALAAALSVLFLILETVSDEYQWKFHQTKKRLLAQGKALSELPSPYDLGFDTMGPWARMRHPNYLGEQGLWLSLYLFVIGAGCAKCALFHWSLIGPLLLVLLFMGSSALGEAISLKKYPLYADYTRRVYKYIPAHRYESGK